jgi:hypothetical protein
MRATEGLDLENELLGNLDLSQEEEYQPPREEPVTVAAAPVPAWDSELDDASEAPAFEPVDDISSGGEVDSADKGLDFADFDAELSSAIDRRLEDEPAIDPGDDDLDDDYFKEAEQEDAWTEEMRDSDAPQSSAPADDGFRFEAGTPPTDDAFPEEEAVDREFTAQTPAESVSAQPTFHDSAEPPLEPSRQAPAALSLEEELTMLLAGSESPRGRTEHAEAGQSFATPPHEPQPTPADEIPLVAEAPVDRDAGYDTPDIETLDMGGYEPIRSDDLELPELPAEEPVQPPADIDDLAAELNKAFDYMDGQTGPSAVEAAYAAPADDAGKADPLEWEREWDAAAIGVAAAGAAGTIASASREQTDYGIDEGLSEFDSYRHDEPLEMEAQMPPPVPSRPDNRRRNMMVAGGVLGIALIGIVGVFAMWSGGGSGGEPVLLQADADPVRVRPEEPGGAVVPNQDNEVYQRVAGGQEEPEPSQERLIDTAEEPVDLTVQDGPRIVGPRIELTADPVQDNALAPVKSEDRLDAEDEQLASASASEDFVALQPRRVRTMVVRPDGTIVPREDPEPAVTEQLAPVAAEPEAQTFVTQEEAPATTSEEIALAPGDADGDHAAPRRRQPAQQEPQTLPPAQTQQPARAPAAGRRGRSGARRPHRLPRPASGRCRSPRSRAPKARRRPTRILPAATVRCWRGGG